MFRSFDLPKESLMCQNFHGALGIVMSSNFDLFITSFTGISIDLLHAQTVVLIFVIFCEVSVRGKKEFSCP